VVRHDGKSEFAPYLDGRSIRDPPLFGVSHGYQGVEACVKIAIFGGLYGFLALWLGSLRPGMIAHGGSDILSGIFGV
jgi:hypothetical protein